MVIDYVHHPHLVHKVLRYVSSPRALRNLRLTCRSFKHFVDVRTQSLWPLSEHPRTSLAPWRRTFILFGGLHRLDVRLIEVYTPNGSINPVQWRAWAAPLVSLTAVNRDIYRSNPVLILPALTQRYTIHPRTFYKDSPLAELVRLVATVQTRGDTWVIGGMEGWNSLVTVAPQRGGKKSSFEKCFRRAVEYRCRSRLGKKKEVKGRRHFKVDVVGRETLVYSLGEGLVRMLDDASRAMHC